MCTKKTILTFLLFAVCFIHNITAEQTKQVICTGKTLDAQGRPITGAKIAAYEMYSNGIAGNVLLRKISEVTTAEDGLFTFKTEQKPVRGIFLDSYIVATKQNLALGWLVWDMGENVEKNIQLSEPTRLEGVIVDQMGNTVADAQVHVMLYRTIKTKDGIEKNEWLPGISPLEELVIRTNNQGGFIINDLPADLDVDLLVKAEGRATIFTYRTKHPQHLFKTGQTNIKVALPTEACIEGEILDPDTGKGIPGLEFAVVYTGSGVYFYRFVCTTDDNGAFRLGGLLSGEYMIRGGRRNSLQAAHVNAESGQTKKVTIRANKLYYGRIVFEDESPIVIKPEPWPGAKTSIRITGEGDISNIIIYDIEDDGYFEIYLSQEQYLQFKSGKAWFMVSTPYKDEKTNVVEDVFSKDLLSTDKAKAGVARIPKPKVEPASLIDKQLPELKTFNLDLSRASTMDKIILVCFFDMQQRPSRNCIMQLSTKAQELKSKEVIVLAIQASKIEQGKLDEWIKENNVGFPVGMIESDEEKTCFNWGVKSLPWLILTDKNHVVKAEGFGIDELEEKINSPQ